MKKAIITTGGKQYLVSEGDVIDVELLKENKAVDFQPLLFIDGDVTVVGTPLVENVKVKALVVEPMVKADKVVSIRYKAKKRVNKVQGHRQKLTKLVIQSIG